MVLLYLHLHYLLPSVLVTAPTLVQLEALLTPGSRGTFSLRLSTPNLLVLKYTPLQLLMLQVVPVRLLPQLW